MVEMRNGDQVATESGEPAAQEGDVQECQADGEAGGENQEGEHESPGQPAESAGDEGGEEQPDSQDDDDPTHA